MRTSCLSAIVAEPPLLLYVQIVMSANGELKAEQLLKYQPICIDVAVDGSRVVVGSSDKKKVHTFLLQDDQTLVKNKATDPNSASPLLRCGAGCLLTRGMRAYSCVCVATWIRGADAGTTCVSVSPNGALIAYGDADKEIRVVDAETKKFKMLKGLWTNHNARITSVAWNASSNVCVHCLPVVIRLCLTLCAWCSQYVASTGMFDFRIRSWNMDTGKKCKVYKRECKSSWLRMLWWYRCRWHRCYAHRIPLCSYAVASVPVATAWLGDNTLFSIGE